MKVILNEDQLKKLTKNLKEDISTDNTYKREVKVDFLYNYDKFSFKGYEIDSIESNENVRLTFLIDMDIKSWGIKDLSLYGIKGPETLNIRVDYYGENSEESKWNTDYEYVDINLDWNKLETDSTKNEGIITIGDTLQITLVNDENGNIVVSGMNIDVYTL